MVPWWVWPVCLFWFSLFCLLTCLLVCLLVFFIFCLFGRGQVHGVLPAARQRPDQAAAGWGRGRPPLSAPELGPLLAQLVGAHAWRVSERTKGKIKENERKKEIRLFGKCVRVCAPGGYTLSFPLLCKVQAPAAEPRPPLLWRVHRLL